MPRCVSKASANMLLPFLSMWLPADHLGTTFCGKCCWDWLQIGLKCSRVEACPTVQAFAGLVSASVRWLPCCTSWSVTDSCSPVGLRTLVKLCKLVTITTHLSLLVMSPSICAQWSGHQSCKPERCLYTEQGMIWKIDNMPCRMYESI